MTFLLPTPALTFYLCICPFEGAPMPSCSYLLLPLPCAYTFCALVCLFCPTVDYTCRFTLYTYRLLYHHLCAFAAHVCCLQLALLLQHDALPPVYRRAPARRVRAFTRHVHFRFARSRAARILRTCTFAFALRARCTFSCPTRTCALVRSRPCRRARAARPFRCRCTCVARAPHPRSLRCSCTISSSCRARRSCCSTHPVCCRAPAARVAGSRCCRHRATPPPVPRARCCSFVQFRRPPRRRTRAAAAPAACSSVRSTRPAAFYLHSSHAAYFARAQLYPASAQREEEEGRAALADQGLLDGFVGF